jgi:hypothetical protein
MITRILTTLLLLVVFTSHLSAQSADSTSDASKERFLSATLAPLNILNLYYSLNIEVNTGDGHSVAGIGALTIGSTKPAYYIGVQGNWYLVGGFNHGFILGLETYFMSNEYQDPHVFFMYPEGKSAGLGGYMAYKFIVGKGFTGCIQAGWRALVGTHSYTSIIAHLTGDVPFGEDAWGPDHFPLLNLYLGWSF